MNKYQKFDSQSQKDMKQAALGSQASSIALSETAVTEEKANFSAVRGGFCKHFSKHQYR